MTDTAKVSLKINQGATFRHKFTWSTADGTPVNLTGFTGRMQARASIDNPVAVVTLTTENGGIILSPTQGEIQLFISALATSQMVDRKLVYDIELQSPAGEVTRVAMGTIDVSKEVTRL